MGRPLSTLLTINVRRFTGLFEPSAKDPSSISAHRTATKRFVPIAASEPFIAANREFSAGTRVAQRTARY